MFEGQDTDGSERTWDWTAKLHLWFPSQFSQQHRLVRWSFCLILGKERGLHWCVPPLREHPRTSGWPASTESQHTSFVTDQRYDRWLSSFKNVKGSAEIDIPLSGKSAWPPLLWHGSAHCCNSIELTHYEGILKLKTVEKINMGHDNLRVASLH